MIEETKARTKDIDAGVIKRVNRDQLVLGHYWWAQSPE